MAFDPFGVKNEPPAPSAPECDPVRSQSPRKTLWGSLLAANVVFILVCAGGLYARARHLAAQPTARPAAARPAPKPAPAAEASPTPAKEEPKPEAKPAPAPEAKAPTKEAPKPAPAKEAPKPAPAAEAPKAAAGVSKPVDFSYTDASAKEVRLLGAFLVRTNGSKPMFKDSSGEWKLTVYLKSGTKYSYRFESVDAQGKRRISKKQVVDVP